MKTGAAHTYKLAASKWMLAVVLLLSIFTFSGLSASSHYAPSPVQTSWTARGDRPFVKAIQYSIRTKASSDIQNIGSTISCLIHLSRLHNNTSATRLKLCRNCNFSNTHIILFGLNKTIPQNGKADPSSVLA